MRRARLLVPLLLLTAGCAGATAHPAAAPTPTPSPTQTTPTPRPTPRPAPTRTGPPFAVGIRSEVIEEPAGYTPPRGSTPGHQGRTLLTTFWYPTAGPAGPTDHADAAPARGGFPLVVFAHGFSVTPQFSEPLLHVLAAAGYVVAAPLFPIEGGGLPGPPSESDMPRQPADMSTVLSVVERRDAAPGHWLAGAVAPDLVAVVGHSDGAETVAAMVLDSTDPRVRAAVMLAGQVLPGFPADRSQRIPTLVEQGAFDTINPPYLGEQLFAQLAPPKAYLDVLQGTHAAPIDGAGPEGDAVRGAVVAFLDAALRHSSGGWARLVALGDMPGVTRLTLVGTEAGFTGR